MNQCTHNCNQGRNCTCATIAVSLPSTEALRKENNRLSNVEFAFDEWIEKTNWVQHTANASELGKHRADVLRERIETLRKENEQLHQLITDLELKSKLAPDHNAMRVDYSGLLGQCARALKRSNSGEAEMLRQLKGHLQELGQQFYGGDIAAVDEFLQLYCIESDLRLKLKGGTA